MGLNLLIMGIVLIFAAKLFSVNGEETQALPPDLDKSKPTLMVCGQRFHLNRPDKDFSAFNSVILSTICL